MEKGQAKRGGRRRRPPSRKPAGEGTASAERPPESFIPSAAAPPDAPNTSGPAAESRPKRPRNKPKRAAPTPADQAAPSGGHPPPAAPPGGEPLTWQQQSMLNAAAPDFRPSGALAPPPKAPRPPRRKAKQPAPPPSLDAAAPSEAADDSAVETDAEPAEEAPHCLLCCSAMALASFGWCGHVAACGPCALRLRMCYGRTDCPLCKADLTEVVIAPWRPQLPDFRFFAESPAAAARSRPGELGPGCVLADRWQPPPRQPTNRLLHDLVRSTGLACSLCDPEGRHPFPRPPLLEAHVREAHGRHLCGMCLREGREFPLDAPLYGSEREAADHAAAAHPRCEFAACRGRRFFDSDALWRHMVDRHHRCQLCEPGPGGSEPWFADLEALRGHLAADHFACEDPDCASCLVAFTTPEELRRHHTERHSARLARWNPAAARPLQLDIQFVRRPTGESGPGAGGGGAQGRRRGGGPGGPARPAEWARESEGGVRIIDDDLGMLYEAVQGGGPPGRGRSFGGADFSAFAARQRGGRAAPPPDEAFPSLAAAAVEAAADRGDARGGAVGAGTRRPPPLVKHTARCPCGRRVTYPVLEEGQPVPPLECDAVCRLEGRRRALADAFGVGDPDAHLSAFDRRPAVWSGELLAAARRDGPWVERAERQLAAFVADRAQKRLALPPAPRAERWLWHALAEQYGIATASTGQEPHRCVELFKTGVPGIPSRPLSKVAATVSDAEVATLLVAAAGHPLRFTDIAPACDLRYYLRRWEGRFRIEWEGGTAATVTFEAEPDRQEALDAFGGGIRGLFLVDRGWRPRTGVATGEAHGGGGAAPWAAQEQRGQGARGGGGDWRGVATSPAGAEGGEGENGAAVRSGWAVIGGKKAVKPRVAATAAAAAGAGAGAASGPGPASNFAALSLDEQ